MSDRFSFLHYDSEFRNSLSTIEIDEFLPTLTKLFKPIGLNEVTISIIVKLDELLDRPELIIPLLPFIQTYHNISDFVKMRCAKIAYLAGERSFSVHILKKRAEKYLLRESKNSWYLDYALVEILTEISPSAALRVIRKTRQKEVKKDSEETNPERINILSGINEKLGR
ncbi:MAG: hypothetical protein GY714_31800 [Desulfobacterales bacterium]|nr:hypothetical protein [Desulfobacterales bacterium]